MIRNTIAWFLLCGASFAADLTGTVTNKTVGKPAAGDTVTLLKLEQGMNEVGSTKTDTQGRFKFSAVEDTASHLIRVNHHNVNYFRPAPAGTGSVEVDVFDVAEKVEGVKLSLDVNRIEADGGSMRVIQFYEVMNESKPPRTMMSAKGFEFVLPEGAQIQESLAAGPGGMPVTTAPVPTGEKNHYAFLFPVRPGATRFQVAYTLAYSGSATVTPVLLRPTEDFAVSVPKSMQLTPATGSPLARKGEEGGLDVFVANNVGPGSNVGFSVSGTGVAPATERGGGSQGAPAGGDNSGRPGGGLGAPVNSPDPLSKYQWWIIGGIAIALVAGAGWMMSKTPVPAIAGARPGSLMETLKQELFELESERLQKKISDDEYAKQKSALEIMIKRALEKQG
ncbi:MAG: carboxypeptidase regulatory-like domain-containing protein [Acidobacteriales bacterium]|nr:carboxypeptidase regulatory-like domain-containing protein [Terriglobales bacterium]